MSRTFLLGLLIAGHAWRPPLPWSYAPPPAPPGLHRAERAGAARDELNIEFGRLQLEQATWAESNRIDQVARSRLGMMFPRTDDIVVLRHEGRQALRRHANTQPRAVPPAAAAVRRVVRGLAVCGASVLVALRAALTCS